MTRLLRPSTVLALVLAAVVVSAAPASAAVVVSHSGSHGHYEVTDKATASGARCTYETVSYDLDKISVRGPKVWSRASDVDGQRRAWTTPETQNSRWRVEIVINWYHFSDIGPPPLDGTVTLRLQHYTETWNGHAFGNQSYCAGHF